MEYFNLSGNGIQVSINSVSRHDRPQLGPSSLGLLVVSSPLFISWHPPKLQSIAEDMCVHCHIRMTNIKQVDDCRSFLANARKAFKLCMHTILRFFAQVFHGCLPTFCMHSFQHLLNPWGLFGCKTSALSAFLNSSRPGNAYSIPCLESCLQLCKGSV